MRHLIAQVCLWIAVLVGGGAVAFAAVVLKRMAVLAYWEWKLGRALSQPTRSPIRLVKGEQQ